MGDDDFFPLLLIGAAIMLAIFMTGFAVAKLAEADTPIKGALAVSCSDRGCSLLYRFPSQERRWIWIPNAALPAERQEE